MDALYDADFLLWSEQQATLLRRLAQGERVNDAVDWEHLIEEVGDLGLSQLNAVESLLLVGLRHLLLTYAAPSPELAGHWRVEADTALLGAARRFTPSMRRRLDLDATWRRARTQAITYLGANADRAGALPEACPLTLDDLLRPEPDLDSLRARLGPP